VGVKEAENLLIIQYARPGHDLSIKASPSSRLIARSIEIEIFQFFIRQSHLAKILPAVAERRKGPADGSHSGNAPVDRELGIKTVMPG